MNVPKEFSIIDNRNMKDFSIATFSKYKNIDVIKKFDDSIIRGNLEEACNWLIELHISGKMNNIWEVIFCAISKNINIKNPNLISWTWLKYIKYEKIIKKINKSYEYESRNNQEIRNLFADVITILICSDKSQIFDKLPKFNNKDLIYNNYSKKIKFLDQSIINDIFPDKNNMDKEFKIGINEIGNQIKNGKIEELIFWCIWLDKLEKSKKKNGMTFICPEIEIKDINKKYQCDWVWSVWYIILLNSKHSDILINEINALYNIYKWKYSTATRNKKQYILYHSLLLLKNNINWKIPLIYKYEYRIQACCNINQLYKLKKMYEIKHIKDDSDNNNNNSYKQINKKAINNKPEINIKTETKPKKPFQIKEKNDEQAKIEANMMKKMDYFNNIVFYKPKHSVQNHNIKKDNHRIEQLEYKNIKYKYR